MGFQLGDRVRAIAKWDSNGTIVGKNGTVVNVSSSAHLVGVAYDERIRGGWNLNGRCDDGYGWNTHVDCLELIEEELPAVPKIDFNELF